MVVNAVFGSSSLKYYLIFYLCFEKLGKRILVMFLLNLLLWKSYNRCALALFEICVFCLLSFCVRVSSLGYHGLPGDSVSKFCLRKKGFFWMSN